MFKSIRTLLFGTMDGTVTSSSKDKIIHRVKVLNLPPKDTAPIKKLFNNLGIKKYRKAPQWNYAYINCESEWAAKETMATLNRIQYRKKTLTTEYAQIEEEVLRQRSLPQQQSISTARTEDTRSFAERLADQVTPLYKMPYEDQLAKKHKSGIRQLRTLRKKLIPLAEMTAERKAQLGWVYENMDDPPCSILDPIGSPDIEGYRTKCEFSIGKDPHGQPTVGFLEGLYRDGLTHVLEPSETIHIPRISKQIAQAMEQYVRASTYPVYDRTLKQGVWRSLMVKAQQTGDVMVVIQMKTSGLSEEQIADEKKKLSEYWRTQPIKTLMVQQWNGESNGMKDEPAEVLIGDGYVYERIMGQEFRISSQAFFQVNTSASERMFRMCAEWCTAAGGKTTLLDLCCGCGSIGITMAKSVERVVGIEMVADAIEDARFNARLNNITNVEYYAGKVEEKIDVVRRERNEHVVAVLDPPRSGVHSSVIRAVRESPQISKVIFISCDAKQAMQNFIRPTSNKYQGTPFRPSRAVTIDLFPHTDHAELMIEFVRI